MRRPEFLSTLYVSPLSDGVNWRHNDVFGYYSAELGRVIESPRGRITDFTSGPQIIWNVIPPFGVVGPAAAVHDECYWRQFCTREQADNVIREGMQLLGVSAPKIAAIYENLRVFGQHAWDRNAQLKASGYTRLAPMTDYPPFASVT